MTPVLRGRCENICKELADEAYIVEMLIAKSKCSLVLDTAFLEEKFKMANSNCSLTLDTFSKVQTTRYYCAENSDLLATANKAWMECDGNTDDTVY